MSYSQKLINQIQSGELENINELLKQAVENDVDEDVYLLADSLFQLGFLQETKTVLHQLQLRHPEDDEIKVNLAEIAIEEGQDLQAIELLDQIGLTSSAYIQSLLVAADYYQTQGLPEVSESKLLEAKKIMPEEPIIHLALGELYYSMGKYTQATRWYSRLLEQGYHDMGGVSIKARLGSAYSASGAFEEATPYLNEATQDDEDIDTLFNLGLTYFQQEEFTRAIESFRRVLSLDHGYTSVYPYLVEALLAEHRLDEAAQVIERGLTLDQTNHYLYLVGAKVAIKQDQFTQARDYFQQAYQINPNSETTILEYANFLMYRQDYVGAVAILEEALSNFDTDPQIYWLLGNAYNELEQFEQAREAFSQAYDFFAETDEFLLDYATFLQEDGQRERLREVVVRYLDIHPHNPEMTQLLHRLDDI